MMSILSLGLANPKGSKSTTQPQRPAQAVAPSTQHTLPRTPGIDSKTASTIRKDAKSHAYSQNGEKARQEMEKRARAGDDHAKQWLKDYRGFQTAKNLSRAFRDEIIRRAVGGDADAQHNIGHWLFGLGSKTIDRNMGYLDQATKAKIKALRKSPLLRAQYVQYREDPSQTQTPDEAYQVALSKNYEEAASGAGHGIKQVGKHLYNMGKGLLTDLPGTLKGVGQQFAKNNKESGFAAATLDLFTGSVTVYKANQKNLQAKSSLEEVKAEYDQYLQQYKTLAKHKLLTQRDHKRLNEMTARLREAETEYKTARAGYIDATGSASAGVVVMVAAGPVLKGIGKVFKGTRLGSAVASKTSQLAARLPVRMPKALGSSKTALPAPEPAALPAPVEGGAATASAPKALPARQPAALPAGESPSTAIVRWEPPAETALAKSNTSIVPADPVIEIIDPTDIVRSPGLEPFDYIDAEFSVPRAPGPNPLPGLVGTALRSRRGVTPRTRGNGVLDSDVALLSRMKGGDHSSELLAEHQRMVAGILRAADEGKISAGDEQALLADLARAWKGRFKKGEEQLVAELEGNIRSKIA